MNIITKQLMRKFVKSILIKILGLNCSTLLLIHLNHILISSSPIIPICANKSHSLEILARRPFHYPTCFRKMWSLFFMMGVKRLFTVSKESINHHSYHSGTWLDGSFELMCDASNYHLKLPWHKELTSYLEWYIMLLGL